MEYILAGMRVADLGNIVSDKYRDGKRLDFFCSKQRKQTNSKKNVKIIKILKEDLK